MVQQTGKEYELKLRKHGSSVEIIMDILDADRRRKLGGEVTVLLGDEVGKIGGLTKECENGRFYYPLKLIKKFTVSDEGSAGDSTFGRK